MSTLSPQFESLEQRHLLSLLGVAAQLQDPDVNYDATGRLAYTAPTEQTPVGSFDSTATPTSFVLVQGARPINIKDPRAFSLHFKTDAAGNVVGGVNGPDLEVDGWIDMNKNSLLDAGDYSGLLLTGEVVQFGWYDSGGPNDNYDFRLVPTGGALMSYFAGKDIGMTLTSLNSTFVGGFASNFVGWAQGVLSPIAPLRGAMSGNVYLDADNSGGLTAGETGIGGVSVALTGTDITGAAVSRSAVTDAGGAYAFAGLLPGTYAVAETQPTGYLTGAPESNAYSAVGLGIGQTVNGLNFGELLPASLSGSVVANGVGLAGVTITLTDAQGAVVNTAVTDTAGLYSFNNLRPGVYAISEAATPGYLQGVNTAGSLGGAVSGDTISAITVAQGQNGTDYAFAEVTPASLSGSVTADGVGLAGVTITLTDAQGAVVNTAVTDTAGLYAFNNLRPGVYAISEAATPGYLQGVNTAGSLGGAVSGDTISGITVAQGQSGTGYAFAEVSPASLSGLVFEDFNDDGDLNFGERAIQGVSVTLTGVDDLGQSVTRTQATDADGVYFFADLRPGTYNVTEAQPAGFSDGADSIGTAGGVAGNDVLSAIVLAKGVDGMNYNFGERPLAGSIVKAGQTATIGFWQNKNGQALIKALNGSSTSRQLGNWLAETFPNMFASLAGKTNAEVAAIYCDVFAAKKGKAIGGPAKLDAQVMASAFAVYVTNQTLAGNAASAFGFVVTQNGVGAATFNVGANGAAFGVANNTVMTVMDLLLATNSLTAQSGVLYSYVSTIKPDGTVVYSIDIVLRTLANTVYTAINEAGDIG